MGSCPNSSAFLPSNGQFFVFFLQSYANVTAAGHVKFAPFAW